MTTQAELAAQLLEVVAQLHKVRGEVVSELTRIIKDVDVTRPSTPGGLSGTPVSETQINLSWNAATDPQGTANEAVTGVGGYRLYRNGSLRIDQAGLTFNDTALAAYTVYSYQVSAYDAAGNEAILSTAILPRTLDSTAPTAPTITASAASSTSISVALTTPSTDAASGVATYRLEYKRTIDSIWVLDSASLTGGSFPRTISGLTSSTSYDTRCRATDVAANVGAFSATSQASTASSESAPAWPAYFNQLPDAFVGVPYSYNLNSLMSADEWRVVRTSFNFNTGHAVLPAGLTLDTDTGIISGTPTTAELFVGQIVATNGTFDGQADFATKAAISGVEWATNFPNLASITDYSGVSTSGRDSATYWSGPTAQGGDNSLVGLSGYAMVQEILPTDEYVESANWKRAIKNAGFGAGLNVGEDLYVYWLTKNNRAEASWQFADVSHQMKIAIIDTASTSSSFEVVAQTWRGGIIRGYYGLSPSDIWDISSNNSCSTTDFRWQRSVDLGANPLNGTDPGLPSGAGDGQPWTACQQVRARYGGLFSYIDGVGTPHQDGFCDPLTGAAYLLIDWWQAWQVHVRRVTSNSTLIEWWWAPLGMDWKLMYTQTVNRGSDGFFSGLHMTNSHTNMIEEPTRPPCYRWTDCIVVKFGGARIPAPGFTS